jgi:hypothetical protein
MTDHAAGVQTGGVTGSPDQPVRRSLQKGRRFYIGAGVFAILLAFAGFGPSLIDHSRRYAPRKRCILRTGQRPWRGWHSISRKRRWWRGGGSVCIADWDGQVR